VAVRSRLPMEFISYVREEYILHRPVKRREVDAFVARFRLRHPGFTYVDHPMVGGGAAVLLQRSGVPCDDIITRVEVKAFLDALKTATEDPETLFVLARVQDPSNEWVVMDLAVFRALGACEVCGVLSANLCRQCRFVAYCGRAHQKEAWKAHKHKCQQQDKLTRSLMRRVLAIVVPCMTASHSVDYTLEQDMRTPEQYRTDTDALSQILTEYERHLRSPSPSLMLLLLLLLLLGTTATTGNEKYHTHTSSHILLLPLLLLLGQPDN
jgi:hypothetical protein